MLCLFLVVAALPSGLRVEVCYYCVGHLFGLRSGDGSQNDSWRFGWRSSPSCLVSVLAVAPLSVWR
ncbi:hypothetical protein Taro_034707 [Colocasia esculenta]|uniref:Secreted protein n=1 Tax=Colocasia esculenta TaxID=4460 RepID=A0A843VS79_COLES|nr:hypothetical protein [Colocasia esculenta]